MDATEASEMPGITINNTRDTPPGLAAHSATRPPVNRDPLSTSRVAILSAPCHGQVTVAVAPATTLQFHAPDATWVSDDWPPFRLVLKSGFVDRANQATLRAVLATTTDRRPAGVYDEVRTTLYQGRQILQR
ncbi:hypothetical protein [Nonomuraea sp. NPDC049750]|uniref:hypothetical protein n=1 Tax=Nonomuraea sp. NPDC049750 TaxID=3154738 RepID=UPI0033CC692F